MPVEVWASESTSAAPRTMLSIPSVTMNGFMTRPTISTVAVREPDAGAAGDHDKQHERAVRAGRPSRHGACGDTPDHACERDDRAYRQIDTASQDHQQLSESEDGDDRRLEAEVGDVALGEEVRRKRRHHRDHERQDQDRSGLDAAAATSSFHRPLAAARRR